MINLHLAVNFLKHYFSSNTRHGVHSPFAYRLVDKIIYDFRAKPEYQLIENVRQLLLNDEREITITDLGAGSQVNNAKRKKINSLARNALKPPRLAQLIYRLAADVQPNTVIELGTCLGITTAYLAKAVPEAKIISIEGCPETAGVAKETLQHANAENVAIHVGNFDTVLPQILDSEQKLDFVFIDGNHRKQATLDYFKMILPKLTDKSVLIFDDIYWSSGMTEAWEEIKAHPDVTLTIDLFWIGLVYVRKGQAREHFRIKF